MVGRGFWWKAKSFYQTIFGESDLKFPSCSPENSKLSAFEFDRFEFNFSGPIRLFEIQLSRQISQDKAMQNLRSARV